MHQQQHQQQDRGADKPAVTATDKPTAKTSSRRGSPSSPTRSGSTYQDLRALHSQYDVKRTLSVEYQTTGVLTAQRLNRQQGSNRLEDELTAEGGLGVHKATPGTPTSTSKWGSARHRPEDRPPEKASRRRGRRGNSPSVRWTSGAL